VSNTLISSRALCFLSCRIALLLTLYLR
jgi:hypothetical protein